MVRPGEVLGLILGAAVIVAAAGWADPFLVGVPMGLVAVLGVNWYLAVLRTFRSGATRRTLGRGLLVQALATILVVVAVGWLLPDVRTVLEAVYGAGALGPRRAVLEAVAARPGPLARVARQGLGALGADGRLARSRVESLLLVLALLSPLAVAALFGRAVVEDAFRRWSQRFFLRHQERVAAFVAEDEEVRKGFLAIEGLGGPFAWAFLRPTLVLFTERRLILLREGRRGEPPLELRTIPLPAMRAVRGAHRFLSLVGLGLGLELINRSILRLWCLSRVLGEEVGDALANVAQQQHFLQAAFEGPVVTHHCPWCFTEAGKGARRPLACGSCGRSLVRSWGRVALICLGLGTLAGLLVTAGGVALAPAVRAVARGDGGQLLILEASRVIAFSAEGRRVSVTPLPHEMRRRGGGRWLAPAGSRGVLVGGASGVWLRAPDGGFRTVLESAATATLLGCAVGDDGRVRVVERAADEWFLSERPWGGTSGRRIRMSLLPVAPPASILGLVGDELLVVMAEGGVARYKPNGERAGWLCQPGDAAHVAGGAVVEGGRVLLVDLLELRPWTLSTEGHDLIHTVTSAGIVDSRVLGTLRLPLWLQALAPRSDAAVRPSVVGPWSSTELVAVDPTAGRVVRISAAGAVRDCPGADLAEWARGLRRWTAATVLGLFTALGMGLLWGAALVGGLVAGRGGAD